MFSLSTARRPNTAGVIYLASSQPFIRVSRINLGSKPWGPRQIHL